jgi:hypothetical protein
MKQRYLPFYIGVFFITLAGAFKISSAQSSSGKKTSVQIVAEDAESTTIKFEFGEMKSKPVSTPEGEAISISIDDGVPMLQNGFPDLPKITSSIIIPDDKQMQVTVEDAHYTEISDVNVAPSKGNILRNVDPSLIDFTYDDQVYGQDVFWPKNIATLQEPYILRDYRGQTVIVYPFQYNPKTKTLRVYSDITVKISPVAIGGENVFQRHNSTALQSEFERIYQSQFLNYQKDDLRYIPLTDRGNMLVICYSDFMSAIQPLVDWKIQEGIKTEVIDVSSIGNDAASIKNYVADYYNTKGLTFLLLVGDYSQVVSSQTLAGVSDNDYGYILGNDHYQEILSEEFLPRQKMKSPYR